MALTKPNVPWYRASRDAWYVEIDGKQIKLAKGKANKDQALAAFHRLMLDRPDPDRRAQDLSVAVVCDLFLESVKSRCRPETFDWYRGYLQSFVSFAKVARLPASKVTEELVTAWVDSRPTWGASSRRAAIGGLKQAFAWAEKTRRIPSDPIRGMKKPGAVARLRVLTPAERKTILAAVRDGAFRDYVVALQETGARPSEVATVTAADVDLVQGVWTLDTHKTRKKTGKPRVVYLTPAAVELTRRKMAALAPGDDGPLFRNRLGRPYTRNAVRIRFLRLREKHPQLAGVTAYAYRHTFATDALENGVGIAQVAELLGHTSTEMVMRHYSKLGTRVRHLRDMAAKAVGGVGTSS